MRSIIQKERECYFCFSTVGLETHHCLHGTANRKKADADGLTVWPCRQCHAALHDRGEGDNALKVLAQRVWMRANNAGEDAFRERYGKSYLHIGEKWEIYEQDKRKNDIHRRRDMPDVPGGKGQAGADPLSGRS